MQLLIARFLKRKQIFSNSMTFSFYILSHCNLTYLLTHYFETVLYKNHQNHLIFIKCFFRLKLFLFTSNNCCLWKWNWGQFYPWDFLKSSACGRSISQPYLVINVDYEQEADLEILKKKKDVILNLSPNRGRETAKRKKKRWLHGFLQ